MYLSQQADRERLPVALLAGFLGSGKTTLINALLRDARMAGTAVAVNEFGEMPIDHALIEDGAERAVVMANGCLCCNLAGDLDQAVMRLFARRESGQLPRFARLIIEPSGLADPAPIAQAILRNPVLSRALRLASIVTTVDGVFGTSRLRETSQTRKQVSLADTLVITKPDLSEPAGMADLRASLRSLNPHAPIIVAEHGESDPDILFPTDPLASAGYLATSCRLTADDAEPDSHLQDVASISLAADQPLDWSAFDLWLRRIRLGHSERLLRVKGLLDIAGVAGPVVVQGVHHVMHAPVAMDAWPDQQRTSRLVMIADTETIEMTRASWMRCLPALTAQTRH
jgi:G3E family GTPase